MIVLRQQVPFHFRLSYWTFFSVRRPMTVHAYGLDDEPRDAQALAPTEKTQDAADKGFLLRAVPLAAAPVAGEAVRDGAWIRYVLQCFPRYYIDMRQSFEDYRQKFSSKTRSTLGRKVKKFGEHCGGELRWRVFREGDELDEFFTLARVVSQLTYQERLLDAGLPSEPSFIAQAKKKATNGDLRAFLLFDKERPVAYLYCPIEAGVIDYAYLGYDPEYAQLSAGTVLQWLALESMFAEGRYRYFDFTEGESEHKRLFATGRRECANIAFLSPSISNRALVAAHRALNRFADHLRAFLERYRLKSRITRWVKAVR